NGKESEKEEIVDHNQTDIKIDEAHDDEEIASKSSERSGEEEEYKIDKLFYQICYFCFILGVNFYRNRCPKKRFISMSIVLVICSINIYFVGYVAYLCLSKKFDADRVATSISIGTWILQATLSTFFLAWWQYTSQPCRLLKLLFEANKGLGIRHHRKSIIAIVRTFYAVLGLGVFYYVILIITNLFEYKVGFVDDEIHMVFGDRRLFIIVQLANLYCILCWGVALFIFSLLIHSTYYEFVYYNEQVKSLLPRDKCQSILEPVCGCDHSVEHTCTIQPQEVECDYEFQTDDALCNYLIKLIKIHNRLTEVVQRLDKMFNRYAFVMIATIIPTSLFSLFMVFRGNICLDLLFSCPLVFFCIFSFFALVNAPSELHDTIYNTKSALCANTNIWFPYRPNVYHSALAFVCHLDQTNLGVSIWGFAVVSKPLVLTTLSVMVTCLALFLQLGDCNSS
ncbi:hypothetical protein PRIPAC_79751, partial [Pristionchus pacificus]